MKICFIHTLSHVSFLINIMPRSSTSQVDADANEHGRRGEDGSRQGGCFSFSKVVYEDMVYVYLCVYINIYIYI